MRMLLAAAVAAMAFGGSAAAETAYDFTFPGITGQPLALSAFAGRPILITNTASRCGYTYQYEGLQEVWDRYRDRGLVVIGVPSNDFRQELASEDEVRRFCEVNFDIDFPMTAITHVAGSEAHPFFRWIEAEGGTQPTWNFKEYLIGPDGHLAAEFTTRTEPTDAEVIAAIERTLGP